MLEPCDSILPAKDPEISAYSSSLSCKMSSSLKEELADGRRCAIEEVWRFFADKFHLPHPVSSVSLLFSSFPSGPTISSTSESTPLFIVVYTVPAPSMSFCLSSAPLLTSSSYTTTLDFAFVVAPFLFLRRAFSLSFSSIISTVPAYGCRHR